MNQNEKSVFFAAVGIVVALLASVALAEELRDTPTRTDLPPDRVVIPMSMHNTQPVVEARINDQGPYRFLIDTGAAGCGRISAGLAKTLGLEVVGEVMAGDPSGRNTEVVQRVGVDSIELAAARFTGLSMLRRDNEIAIDEQRAGIDGILGFGLFADCLVTFDYPERKLIIERGALPPVDREHVMSFRTPHGIPEVTITVGEVEVDADIDSGSMGPLTVPEAVAEKLSFKRKPIVVGKASTGFNEFEIREGRLEGEVRFAGHVIRDPLIAVVGLFPRGNIGGQFLRDFKVAFDTRNQRLRLTVDETGRATTKPRYRVGMMMHPEPCGLVVDGVVPGSAAEKSGLLVGDCVTQINGKTPDEQGGQGSLREIFGSPSPARLTIDRAGERLEVVVTPVPAE